jgi:hypothetical protein
MDDATKKKISEAMKGRAPINKGKRMPKAQRVKISEALTGRVMSDEWRRRMSLAKIGKKRGPMSDKQRRAISRGMKRSFAE